MSVDTNTSVGGRVISAFFDTRDHAAQAIDDLVVAGIPRQHISRADAPADSETSPAGHRTFWETLQGFFLPDGDRHAYAEGLRRGGTLLTVHTEEGNYTRVLDILDTDGAVDMDERERHWQAEGWDHRPVQGDAAPVANPLAAPRPSDHAMLTGAAYGSSAATASTTETNWRIDGAARAAALDGSVPETARAASVVRDSTMARPRIRSYRFADGDAAERTRQTGGFSPATDAARIVPHMTVYSADGQTIGTVDHLDGPDRIKLAKSTAPDGQHHLVPFTWIDHVDQHVHLHKTLAEITAQQASSGPR